MTNKIQQIHFKQPLKSNLKNIDWTGIEATVMKL